jgi:pimeloyl-ACP methyl ester carboxylesterase
MTKREKLLTGIAVLAVFAAAGVFMVLRLRMQPRFPYMAGALPEAEYLAMAARPGWHGERLKVTGDVELPGLVREPSTPGAPVVLFFSGNSSHLLAEGQQMLEALCAPQGWGGVVWAYRGYDSSAGRPSPEVLADDGFKAYVDLVRRQGVHPGSVHVVGFSLGTSIASAVAARAAANPPASLTLLAPMTSLYLGGKARLRLHRYETLRWLPAIQSPTLVVHGRRDATLGVKNGREVARILGSRSTFIEVPDAGHYELPLSQAAQDAMRTFIREHASAASASH